ncbi:hypothetical protein F3Y22_tig00112206pilonHSYRG00256 [Hibiscus syriacus]|uniref:Uncharacterized protein n=1 Tax=Hibiscus syriacus TaxID=106335 RepID=A0A6A2XJT4_HIBSY|nr:hypothetical protein F3Y22_tig00112206pilonHSYRG00256 [Hibiscus syriacus]
MIIFVALKSLANTNPCRIPQSSVVVLLVDPIFIVKPPSQLPLSLRIRPLAVASLDVILHALSVFRIQVPFGGIRHLILWGSFNMARIVTVNKVLHSRSSSTNLWERLFFINHPTGACLGFVYLSSTGWVSHEFDSSCPLKAHPLSSLVSLHHSDAMDPIFPDMDKTRALEHFLKLYTRAIDSSLTSFHYQNLFFMETRLENNNVIWSNYTGRPDGKCLKSDAIKNLKEIRVVSQKLELDVEQMMAPRRQYCEISALHNELMVINIRKCGADELILVNG